MQPALVHPGVLELRRASGSDLFDEVWDGVLHMVPPPSFGHQAFGSRLIRALGPAADARGLVILYETGLFSPTGDRESYRIPDLMVVRPEHATTRGAEGSVELVVEILSPDDESRDKLPFYAELGVHEIWLIDPETRAVEVWTGVNGPRRLGGASALGVELEVVDGPRLRVTWGDDVMEI